MSLFSSDLGDRLLLSFNSTGKSSLEDIGQDQDEQDKIILNASKSVDPIALRVDYSNFANHIFFNSAFTSVNLATSRIFNDFPTDGTYRDHFEWHRLNNGYENWFYDNFPKQQGYISLNSGSNGPSILLKDYENKINIPVSSVTGAATFEFILKPYENLQTLNPIVSLLNDGGDSGILVYLEDKDSDKWLTVRAQSSGAVNTTYLSFSCADYVSSSNHFAIAYSSPAGTGSLMLKSFVNGEAVASGSNASFGYFNINQPNLKIGHFKSGAVDCYLSGAIDEVRLWNSDRSSFIFKNYFKTIFANPSGGLQVYYRFNEPQSYGNKIIDYSGNDLHAVFSGGFSLTTNRQSGTLGPWFKDQGDPIFDFTNSRVSSFLTEQQNSGSIFDQKNRNYIFNIVPSFFVDEEDADNQKLFLLLLARHYDKLKLYIEHLANINNIALNSKNDTPDQLMNIVAQNYGVDIGDVYDSSDPLQLYFGEGVLGSGSLDSSVESVKNQLKRNVLNNLIYFLKTKSTRESLEAILYSLGANNDAIGINEYSLFSGGIETPQNAMVSECRVANFNTSSNINLGLSLLTSSFIDEFGVPNRTFTHQVRFLFSSGSNSLTSSIVTCYTGSALLWGVNAERENSTSISGVLKLTFTDSGSVLRTISSSLLPLYNGQWNNLAATMGIHKDPPFPAAGFFVSQLDYDSLINSGAFFTSSAFKLVNINNCSISLGTSGTNYFSGYMHEYRLWNVYDTSGSLNLVKKWHTDYDTTDLQNFNNDINNLLYRLKLNDFTSSAATSGVIHDFVSGLPQGAYTGFTTSSQYNFPGMFIPRYVQSYSYDINTNNDKIRIKDQGRKLTPSEQTIDVPFVTVDISPVVSQNKEIIKYFGDLTKFNNIVGHPYNRYREQVKNLHQYRVSFFEKKINNKIDYKSYINLIKWFDNNFTTLLSQFVPIDMISSISNFTIEPGIFDYNKVTYGFPYFTDKGAIAISGTATLRPRVAASGGISIAPADPGRFGASVSASAMYPTVFNLSATLTSSAGLNFKNVDQRNIIYNSMSADSFHFGISNSYYSSSNNSFYSKAISSSNYFKDTLNLNPNFYLSASKIHYNLTGVFAAPGSVFWTSSVIATQDQRWMWTQNSHFSGPVSVSSLKWDTGIGYGGGWGQLSRISQKSFSTTYNPTFQTSISLPTRDSIQYTPDKGASRKVVILWPDDSAYNGITLYSKMQGDIQTSFLEDGRPAASFGSIIDILGYESLTFELLGSYSWNYNTGTALTPATGSTPSNADYPKVYFEVRFQFFDQQIADAGFELASSSSVSMPDLANLEFATSFGERVFYLSPKNTFSWHMSFERAIPNNKFMRVHITPIFLSPYQPPTQVNILCKGILNKNVIETSLETISNGGGGPVAVNSQTSNAASNTFTGNAFVAGGGYDPGTGTGGGNTGGDGGGSKLG